MAELCKKMKLTPERVLKHLAWLAARYPRPTIQEKLAYLQKREAHTSAARSTPRRCVSIREACRKCSASASREKVERCCVLTSPCLLRLISPSTSVLTSTH